MVRAIKKILLTKIEFKNYIFHDNGLRDDERRIE